ncbi:MAG: hypothetical protein OEL79_05085 [Chromatiales bacterium]|nr:hypothetical protein [Chromatiales bacterium]
MPNIKIIITSLLLSALLIGCGSHEQVVQRNELVYIQFVGMHNGETIIIDGAAPYKLMGGPQPDNEADFKKNYIPVLDSFTINGKEATKIQVDKGRHNVKVYRRNDETNNALLTAEEIINSDNELIIDKDIYIASGTTYEFEL